MFGTALLTLALHLRPGALHLHPGALHLRSAQSSARCIPQRIVCAQADEDFDTLFKRGSAYVASGSLALALATFQEAQKLDPDHAPTNELVTKLSAFEIEMELDGIESELAADEAESAASAASSES